MMNGFFGNLYKQIPLMQLPCEMTTSTTAPKTPCAQPRSDARALAVFIAIPLFFFLHFIISSSPYVKHKDEAAWLLSGYYFTLYFTKDDTTSADWRHQDAVDHPFLAKYMFGGIAKLVGHPVETLQLKERWFQWFHQWPQDTDDLSHKPQFDQNGFNAWTDAVISPNVLFWARAANSLISCLAALLLFWIGKRVSDSTAVGQYAATFFTIMPFVRSSSVIATGDALFTFLLIAIVAAHVSITARNNRTPSTLYFFSLLSGILCSALFNTKINGLLSLATSALCIAFLSYRDAHIRTNTAIRNSWIFTTTFALLVLIISFTLTALAINPSLHQDGLNFVVLMFQYRWNAVTDQFQLFPGDALPSFYLRITTFLRRAILDTDPVFSTINIPVILFGTAFGLLQAQKRLRNISTTAGAVLFFGAAWVSATAATYALDWPRYLLPALPFVALFSAWGVVLFAKMLSNN